jgi:hypothetical protein
VIHDNDHDNDRDNDWDKDWGHLPPVADTLGGCVVRLKAPGCPYRNWLREGVKRYRVPVYDYCMGACDDAGRIEGARPQGKGGERAP